MGASCSFSRAPSANSARSTFANQGMRGCGRPGLAATSLTRSRRQRRPLPFANNAGPVRAATGGNSPSASPLASSWPDPLLRPASETCLLAEGAQRNGLSFPMSATIPYLDEHEGAGMQAQPSSLTTGLGTAHTAHVAQADETGHLPPRRCKEVMRLGHMQRSPVAAWPILAASTPAAPSSAWRRPADRGVVAPAA